MNRPKPLYILILFGICVGVAYFLPNFTARIHELESKIKQLEAALENQKFNENSQVLECHQNLGKKETSLQESLKNIDKKENELKGCHKEIQMQQDQNTRVIQDLLKTGNRQQKFEELTQLTNSVSSVKKDVLYDLDSFIRQYHIYVENMRREKNNWNNS